MKKTVLAATLSALVLVGCSSTPKVDPTGIGPGKSATTAISEQTAVSDFKRQGVRVTYTLSGKLEAIEVYGYAPLWGGSQNAVREAYRVAELEAKKSLNDFINKETIKSSVSVNMFSMNLEHARDQKTNLFASNKAPAPLVADDTEAAAASDETSQEENKAVRNDALKIATKVNTTITTSNRGIIGGLYLVEGDVIDDGKMVRVLYRWEKRHTAVRLEARSAMAM
jgi:hypothetical protein